VKRLAWGAAMSLAAFLSACSGDPTGPDGGDGNSRTNPAGLTQAVTTDVDAAVSGAGRIRLTMLSRISGAAALDTVLAANRFNDTPAPGQEYVLARFRLEIVSLVNPSTAFEMWNGHWETVSGTGAVSGDIYLSVCCLGGGLEGEGFAGASWEGWVPFLVSTSDVSPVGVYQRGRPGEAWFRLR